MDNKPMLNAYPDSIGESLSDTVALLEREDLRGTFQSFYILPSMFNTDLDRGFSVISYELNSMLATQQDLDHLRRNGMDLKLDFVLNHLSVLSPQFQDIIAKGDESPYRDFFIDWNRFWKGHGQMTEDGFIKPDPEMLAPMFFRKPGLPLLMVLLPDGTEVPYWNTFYQEVRYPAMDTFDLMRMLDLQYYAAHKLAGMINAGLQKGQKPMELDLGQFTDRKQEIIAILDRKRTYLGQMDLNLNDEKVWDYYRQTLGLLAAYGASIVRLDAFAYASKIPGRRNFLNEPETWESLDRLRAIADQHQITLLPEIHAAYADGVHQELHDKGYPIYDFFLPGLIIDAFDRKDATIIIRWVWELYENKLRTINMLGCHDGIPLLDLRGLLSEERIQSLIEIVVARGGMVKNLHGQKNAYYQVNATYYSALGEDPRSMLLARAIQLFVPGKPQVWYLDLLMGCNDMDAVERGGSVGHKEINRTNWTRQQAEEQMNNPWVKAQVEMIRFRNTFPAFSYDAVLSEAKAEEGKLILSWKMGNYAATLQADLMSLTYAICGYELDCLVFSQ